MHNIYKSKGSIEVRGFFGTEIEYADALLHAEMELNNRISTEIDEKFRIAIRVHLDGDIKKEE